MANMCSNYVVFTGAEDNISRLKTAIEAAVKRETETGKGQLISGSQVKDGFFFDLYLKESEKNMIHIMYETRWAPNTPDVADVCMEFDVIATLDYYEPSDSLFGSVFIFRNGSYKDIQFVRRSSRPIIYLPKENTYMYVPTGETNDSMEELCEKYLHKNAVISEGSINQTNP